MRARLYRECGVLSRRIAFRASIALLGPFGVCCCLLYIEHLENHKLTEMKEVRRKMMPVQNYTWRLTESAEEWNAGLHCDVCDDQDVCIQH